MKLLALQVADGGIAKLARIVGQDFGRETYGNAFGALCQEKRKLDGQRNRFFVAAVVAEFPLGSLGIEEHVEGEFGEARFDVTRSCGRVARQDVTPVALAVHQQVFLSQLHKSVADGGIAVGVKLHGVAHDVGYFVVAAVVQAFHRVQDASLYGFQTVAQVGHGAFENHIRGVVQKPVLVHTCQLVLHAFVLQVGGNV